MSSYFVLKMLVYITTLPSTKVVSICLLQCMFPYIWPVLNTAKIIKFRKSVLK